MNRTYLIFANKLDREKAIDFLVRTSIKYTYNVANDGFCWISFAPSVFIKRNVDLNLNGLFINQFSKLSK